MTGVTIIEEPIPVAPVSHAQDLRELEKDIALLTVALFSKKERLAAMPHHIMHGKFVIPAASEYRCSTCGNDKCPSHCRPEDAHPSNKWPLLTIHNHTAEHGCLDWLPPKGTVKV